MDQEIRTLRWKLSQQNRTMGRQGQTIHDLRCRVAELQEMIGKENRGWYRRLENTLKASQDHVTVLEGEIARLQEKLSLLGEGK